jgi:hypothetical protein
MVTPKEFDFRRVCRRASLMGQVNPVKLVKSVKIVKSCFGETFTLIPWLCQIPAVLLLPVQLDVAGAAGAASIIPASTTAAATGICRPV